MQKTLKLALVGNGNVGTYLHNAFKNTPINSLLFARNPKENEQNLTDLHHSIQEFDVILLCVKDDAISAISESLAIGNYLLAHSSGAVNLSAISQKHNKRAVFYPLMSLKKDALINPASIPFCLEWEHEADLMLLKILCDALKAAWFPVSSEQRQYLHLAAVFAHNFSNHMFTLSQQVLDAEALDFKILLPLIKQNIALLEQNQAKNIQTGPALRKDETTIHKHLTLLGNTALQELYQNITKSIQTTHEQ